MYAEDLLSINDLMFSDRTREIYMEANTIDLISVHFPGNSEVMLRSRDGAPYFYGPGTTNASSGYKPFHVNFYSTPIPMAGQKLQKESSREMAPMGITLIILKPIPGLSH